MVAGPIVDPGRQLPMVTMTDSMVVVNWSRRFQNHRAAVEPYGISYRAKDPIIGLADTSVALVPYDQVATIAVRRRIDWGRLIAGIVFAPLPITLLVGAVANAMFLLFAIPLALLSGWAIWIGVIRQLHVMRLCGFGCSIEIFFDGSKKRRTLFMAETLRRIGAPPIALPQ